MSKPKPYDNYIGETLREYRVKCALTQAQVAAALNLDRSAYSYYESGTTLPNLATLVKLAKIFQVPVEALLPKSEEPNLLHSPGEQMEPIYWLSKEEQALVTAYRVLDKEQREQMHAYAGQLRREQLEQP